MSDNLTIEQVEQNGGRVIEAKQSLSLFDDTLLISGEVPRITSYEKGLSGEFRLQSTEWVEAPAVVDERCLVLNFQNLGLGILTGCGHTGVVNAIKHAQSLTGESKIHFVMGGFHLAGKA